MKFNYQTELKKFKLEHEQIRKVMQQNGMSEESIRELIVFDWKQFKKDRTFCLHNQSLPESDDADADTYSPLAKRFKDSFSQYDEYFQDFRDIAEMIEDARLLKAIRQLNDDQILLLEMIDYGLKQDEIASVFGISRTAVTHRLGTIRKIVKLFYE